MANNDKTIGDPIKQYEYIKNLYNKPIKQYTFPLNNKKKCSHGMFTESDEIVNEIYKTIIQIIKK